MKTVVKMLAGSHLYGLNSENSDTDYKGIVLPSRIQVLSQSASFELRDTTGDSRSKNTSEDVDTVMYSLIKFIDLACKGETGAIDMLHAPESVILETSQTWKYIVRNRYTFYNRNMSAFFGYVRSQAAKYGVRGSRMGAIEQVLDLLKGSNLTQELRVTTLGDLRSTLPVGKYLSFVTHSDDVYYEVCGRKFGMKTKLPYVINSLQAIYNAYGERAKMAKENKGIDWKAVSHALRAGYQVRAIFKDGGFEYPLPETDYIKSVKFGECDWLSDVQPRLEALVAEIEELASKSTLPDKAPKAKWMEFVMDIHESIVTGDL